MASAASGSSHHRPTPASRRSPPTRIASPSGSNQADSRPDSTPGGLPGVDVHDDYCERGDPGDLEGAAAGLVAMESCEQYEADGGK